MNNKCDKCNLIIHPSFRGYHKCGYANCPICKDAITYSEYWYHIRLHPGHENDTPPPPKREKSEKQARGEYSKSHDAGTSKNRSLNSSRGFLSQKPVVEIDKEYEVEITEMSRQGEGIARVQGFVVFVKNGKTGQKVKVKVEQVGNRSARARITT
ncbi:MAG: TRAM domain-containing protein [Nitrososphaeraceae archaeon]|nr:TRAM domain-containing protein [Nitrososphaeraceae archaeon]MBV9667253.1 TRAM domain-containing protein [Nitrososphaeraceae archaeon]